MFGAALPPAVRSSRSIQVSDVTIRLLKPDAHPAVVMHSGAVEVVRSAAQGARATHQSQAPPEAKELLVLCGIEFNDSKHFVSSVPTLCDTGSQICAVAGSKFFEGQSLIQAKRPLRIKDVQNMPIAGGTHGAYCTISLPGVIGEDAVVFRCVNVFVYSAEVCNTIIVGYPFFKAYGLLLDPVHDCLRPAEYQQCISCGKRLEMTAVVKQDVGERYPSRQSLRTNLLAANGLLAALFGIDAVDETSCVLQVSSHPSLSSSLPPASLQ